MLYMILRSIGSERYVILRSNYETNQLKQKYHAILDNLTEGVITKSMDKKFEYFNFPIHKANLDFHLLEDYFKVLRNIYVDFNYMD